MVDNSWEIELWNAEQEKEERAERCRAKEEALVERLEEKRVENLINKKDEEN